MMTQPGLKGHLLHSLWVTHIVSHAHTHARTRKTKRNEFSPLPLGKAKTMDIVLIEISIISDFSDSTPKIVEVNRILVAVLKASNQ